MGMQRALGFGTAYYHCVSRVVDRRIVFHAQEKEVFRSIMRKLEEFCAVRIITYCVMGNHFHLLVEVPDREEIPPLNRERLSQLLPLLYDKATVQTIMTQLDTVIAAGDSPGVKAILDCYEARRGDLSVFLKELKQRCSIFMNRRLGRLGTLWEGPFRSVLVEGGEESLQAVAAYIDLNPVRAGMVSVPEDYRWSGYGEAMGAGKWAKLARSRLKRMQRESLERPSAVDEVIDWKTTLGRYRNLLYVEGREVQNEASDGRPRRGIDPGLVDEVLEGDRRLSLQEVLRRKVRYFSDGAVLGSAAFVDAAAECLKARGGVGPNRKSGARRMRGADWGGIRVLRALELRVFDPPLK